MQTYEQYEDRFFNIAFKVTKAVRDQLRSELYVSPSLKDSLDTVKLFYTRPIADAV
jgi:hypothetical protein